jgi:hypothetical protein
LPGRAPAAPRVGKGAPVPGQAPMARPRDEPPKIVHKLSIAQSDALKAALKDLTDARKLLDPALK